MARRGGQPTSAAETTSVKRDPFLIHDTPKANASASPFATHGKGQQAHSGGAPFSTHKDLGGKAHQDGGMEDRPPPPFPARQGRLNPWSAVLLGVYLPCYLFVMILTLFTYVYHRAPAVPWMAVVLGADIVVVTLWPSAHHWPGRGRWDWFPLISGLCAIGLATWLGLINYSTMELWVHAKHLHSYDNVNPTSDTNLVGDAGLITFAPGSELDISSSAGFKAWPYTYCAAPIVSAGSSGTAQQTSPSGGSISAPQPLGFWAVGIDCCNSAGDFWCDDAKNSDARSGLRVTTHWIGQAAGHDVLENYGRAARKAAAMQGTQVAQTQVFLLWHKHPNSVAIRRWWAATGLYGGLVVASIGCCFLVRWILRSLTRIRAQPPK